MRERILLKRQWKCIYGIFTILLLCSYNNPLYGEVLWDGDASKGIEVFKLLNLEGQGNTVTVVDDPVYGKVFRFYKPASARRCEAHGVEGFQAEEGDLIYIGWRCKVVMSNRSARLYGIFQWKCYGDHTADHPVIIKPDGGRLVFEHYGFNQRKTDVLSLPMPASNTWFTLVITLKVSRDPSTGYIEVWYNGEQQTLENGSTRLHGLTLDGSHTDPKWGAYGGEGTEVTCWTGNLIIASDYASAVPREPTPVGGDYAVVNNMTALINTSDNINIFNLSGRVMRKFPVSGQDCLQDRIDQEKITLSRGIYFMQSTDTQRTNILLVK